MDSKKYKVEMTQRARKQFAKLDNSIQTQISDFFKKEAVLTAPDKVDKPLRHSFIGLWRYHIGSFRVIAKINEDELVILIIMMTKRDKVYN